MITWKEAKHIYEEIRQGITISKIYKIKNFGYYFESIIAIPDGCADVVNIDGKLERVSCEKLNSYESIMKRVF